MSRASQARRYDLRSAEQSAEERRAIVAAGGVAPFRDGTPKTVIGKTADLEAYVGRCSCGWTGTPGDYRTARDEARAHRCEVANGRD